MLQTLLKRKLEIALAAAAIAASLSTPGKASFLPTRGIDFGAVGGSQTPFGSLGGIMGELGINLPDISNVLGDFSSSIPNISIEGITDGLNIDLGNLGGLETLFGDMGIPNLDNLLASVLGDILRGGAGGNPVPGTPPINGSANPAGNVPPGVLSGASSNITPGVNPTIAANVDAVGGLTEAITAIGLSEAGQTATKGRLDAAKTGADNAQALVQQSLEALATQVQTAEQVVSDTNAQTSTQDVLKTALSGLVSLQAATSSQLAYGRQQDAIDTQLQLLDLQFARESRDGTYANGKNLQLINQQLNQELQRDIASTSSAAADAAHSLRLIHVLR